MKILDRLPYGTEPSTVDTVVGPIAVFPYQIIVWLSLRTDKLHSRPFPSLLDTGSNLTFILNEFHLQRWLDLRPEQFFHRAMTRIDGENLPVRVADVILHKNVRGTNRIASGSFELATDRGMVVYPRTVTYPRLPVLGLRAVTNSNLRVVIDGRKNHVSVDNGWRLFG